MTMKKAKIFFWAGLMATTLASCNKYEAKTVQLNSMNDSLNYTLGLANGSGIKQYYLANDTTGKAVTAFMDALNEAYKKDGKAENNEMFELGKRIGSSFKGQKEEGLIGDNTLTFNEELVMQGLINGLSKFDKGMTAEEAKTFFQTTIQEMRMAKEAQPTPAPAPAPAE